MLLRKVVLLIHVALQSGEDVALVKEILAAALLEIEQRVVCDPTRVRGLRAILGGNGEVFEFFTENYDGLLRQ